MAQRIRQLFDIYYGIESTEGIEVLGVAATALLVPELPSMRLPRTTVPRKFLAHMGNFLHAVTDQSDPGLGFSTELRSRGVTNFTPDEDELYTTVFGTRTLLTADTTVLASPGPTTTVFTVASIGDIVAGVAIMVETATTDRYEVGWVKSIASAAITLEKALTFTPATSAKVKPMLTYAPANSGHQSLSFQLYLDATDFISWLGCKGTLAIRADGPGEIPMVDWNWEAMGFTHSTSGTRPTPLYSTSGPPPSAISALFQIGTTKTDTPSLSVDLAQKLGRKPSQNSTHGTAGIVVVDRDAQFAMRPYDADQTEWTAWSAGTERDITQQYGNELLKTVGWRIPKAQNTSVAYGEEGEGATTDDVGGSCNITTGADEFYLAFG